MKASSAPYQAERRATLRAITRAEVLANARKIARENQRNGFSYKRATLNALKGKAS